MALKSISPNPIQSSSQIPKSDYGLRPYQVEAKRNIYEAWDKVDDVMFQMPTGTGKTVLFASIINELDLFSRLKGTRPINILIIAHRNELIEQISNHLSRRGVHHGIIKGGVKKDYSFHVQVGSINTVTHKAREVEIRNFSFDYIIIDEAHHSNAESYKKLWEYFPNSKKLGVTATPYRLDGKGLCDLYETLILSQPVKAFIEQGFLSPYKYYSVPPSAEEKEALRSIKKFVAGDYDATELERKFDTGRIRARLYESYQQYAYGKKGIVYAIKVAHSEHICEEYRSHGIKAVSISAKTSDTERKDLVRKFKEGEIEVLVNVDIFSEGFDCPDIEFIQLARPTQSLSKYLQQVGRGLRITENKSECIILDNVGMYENFGLPDANRKWNHHFLGKEVTEDSRNTTSDDSSEFNRQERDTSEGEENMILIQGNDYTEAIAEMLDPGDYPPFVMPDRNAMTFSDYLGAIGYAVEQMAFSFGEDIFDFFVTEDFRIAIFEVPIIEKYLEEAYVEAYECEGYGKFSLPGTSPFESYWEMMIPRIVALIEPQSVLFDKFIKRQLPISSITIKPDKNYVNLAFATPEAGIEMPLAVQYNARGEMWLSEDFNGSQDSFFTVNLDCKFKNEIKELAYAKATLYSTYGMFLIEFGGNKNRNIITISSDSALGKRIAHIQKIEFAKFYLVSLDEKLGYYDTDESGALYFTKEGLLIEDELPDIQKVHQKLQCLEKEFIKRIVAARRKRKPKKTLEMLLNSLYLNRFINTRSYFLGIYDGTINPILEEEHSKEKVKSKSDPLPNDAIDLGSPCFYATIKEGVCNIHTIGRVRKHFTKLKKIASEIITNNSIVMKIQDREYLVLESQWSHPLPVLKRVGKKYICKQGDIYYYAQDNGADRFVHMEFRNGFIRAYSSRNTYQLFDSDLNFIREYSSPTFTGPGYLDEGKRVRVLTQ